MAQPTWDITDGPSRANVDRILVHLKSQDSIPPEAVEALGAYLTRLANENERLATEVERLKTGAKLPSRRRETLTVHVQHGEYQKSQPVILVRWTCQECGKQNEREQLPGGIPKYCLPAPDGTPSACQLKARARAVEKQRLKRQAQRQGKAAELGRDSVSINNHSIELPVPVVTIPTPTQELASNDHTDPVQLWHELGGQSQQYLIEVCLAGPKGKRMRDRRRGRDDRRYLWEKKLVTYQSHGTTYMTLTITPLGRDVLRVAPFPGYIGIPVISDLAKAKDLLLAQEQPDRGLTPDELDRLDAFLFSTDTHHILSWPRGGAAWKRDRTVLEKLEAQGLIRLVSKNRREVVYQLTDAGQTVHDDVTIANHNKITVAPTDAKKPSKAAAIWVDLNPRQQITLRVIYDTDQAKEEGEKADRAEGNWDRPPASVWRWMLHATLSTSDTDLKADLRAADVLDTGLGSTFAALEKRGLVQTQNHDSGTEYDGQLGDNSKQWYVFVKLTKLGRAVIRASDPTYKPAQQQPVGTLKERQWEALEALYKAGSDGLVQDDYGNYGGFSWQWTMLRLRDYKAGALAKEAGGGIKSSYPLVKEPYRMVITDFGRQYYEQNGQWYTELYAAPTKPKV